LKKDSDSEIIAHSVLAGWSLGYAGSRMDCIDPAQLSEVREDIYQKLKDSEREEFRFGKPEMYLRAIFGLEKVFNYCKFFQRLEGFEGTKKGYVDFPLKVGATLGYRQGLG
jgi:hypothetical protein